MTRGPSLREIEAALNALQTHCYTCGKELPETGRVACPTCSEWQCSKACCDKHVKDMDAI